MFTAGNQRRGTRQTPSKAAAARECTILMQILAISRGFCLQYPRFCLKFLHAVFSIGDHPTPGFRAVLHAALAER
jgi:hypothetical protein